MDSIAIFKEVCSDCQRIGQELGLVSIAQSARDAIGRIDSEGELRVAFVSGDYRGLCATARELFPEKAESFLPAKSGDVEDTPFHVSYDLSAENCYLGWSRAEFYFSANSFTDFDWKEIFSGVDYVFMIFNAIHMLSNSERSFIEECVRKYVNRLRFGAILSDAEMISTEQDYSAATGRLTHYLEQQGFKDGYCELGADTLQSHIRTTILPFASVLRELTARQIAITCCEDAQEQVSLHLKNADIDLQELNEIIEQLKARAEEMRRQGQAAALWTGSLIKTDMTFGALEGIRNYCDKLREDIIGTLERTSDLDGTLKQLPAYLDAAARNCQQQFGEFTREHLTEVSNKLEERMRADAGEFFSDVRNLDVVIHCMRSIDNPYLLGIDFEMGESDKKKAVEKISKALLYGSIPIALLVSFPLAVGTFAASNLVRSLSQGSIDEDTRRIATEAVKESIQSFQEEINGLIEASFDDLSRKASEGISSAYDHFVATILDALNRNLAAAEEAQKNAQALRAASDELCAVRAKIPE